MYVCRNDTVDTRRASGVEVWTISPRATNLKANEMNNSFRRLPQIHRTLVHFVWWEKEFDQQQKRKNLAVIP